MDEVERIKKIPGFAGYFGPLACSEFLVQCSDVEMFLDDDGEVFYANPEKYRDSAEFADKHADDIRAIATPEWILARYIDWLKDGGAS